MGTLANPGAGPGSSGYTAAQQLMNWWTLFGPKGPISPVPVLWAGLEDTINKVTANLNAPDQEAEDAYDAFVAAHPEVYNNASSVPAQEWIALLKAAANMRAFNPLQRELRQFVTDATKWHANNDGSPTPSALPPLPPDLAPFDK